jgi:predicted CopG family antitoxin
MTDKTMMRANKELLKELERMKLVRGESYAEVVKRLIEKERRVLK